MARKEPLPVFGKRSWVFDTVAVLSWLTRDELAERDKASRQRLAKAKAEIKWLKYGEALGILARLPDVLPPLEEAMQMVRSRMYAIPDRFEQLLSVECDPEVIEKMLRDEIEGIYEQAEKHARTSLPGRTDRRK